MTIVSEKLKSLSKDVQTIKILGLQSTIIWGGKTPILHGLNRRFETIEERGGRFPFQE